MKRERHYAVAGFVGFVVASHQLDVDVLVERARQSVTRARQDAPASTVARGVRDGRLIGCVAESKERKLLERAVEQHRSRVDPPLLDYRHESASSSPEMALAASEHRKVTVAATCSRST